MPEAARTVLDFTRRRAALWSASDSLARVRWLYNILFSIVFWLAAPWLLLKLRRRGAWREAFWQRFGRYQPDSLPLKAADTQRIWLHAVSVGEANTCLQFVQCLRRRVTGVDLVVSTTTNTGMAELRKKLPPDVTPIYFPVDLRGCVRRALNAVRPDAVILMEREIWPNFLWALQSRSIPLMLINARISTRSHRAYRRYGFLFRSLYAQFRVVVAQTDSDARRLRDVGCVGSRLHVCGNMKFDAAAVEPAAGLDVPELLRRAGRKPGAPVLVAGSTHEGEEVLLGQLGNRLRRRFPDLFVVLVPRHFERCPDISPRLDAAGVRHVRRSRIESSSQDTTGRQTLLVDSTGELTAFYAVADVVFIGKSLCARGGQNPIEPAVLGKAIVMGPHMQNFSGVTRQLLDGNGAVQVKDETELETILTALLAHPARRKELGTHARAVVDQNSGATDRTADLILNELSRWPAAESSGGQQ